ncbi:MAG: magnesium chelatase [Burkholderia sp.]|nr:magnesium chelatase [Burkholderia sp.]
MIGRFDRLYISDNSIASKTVSWPATLSAKRSEVLHANHLRFRKRFILLNQIHCLLLDSSASMLAHGRLARAKGLIISYFNRASRARIKTALICFNGAGVIRHFGPAVPRWWNERWLTYIGGGGGTPFIDGINAAEKLLSNSARRDPLQQRWLFVLSDGYTSEIPNRPTFADHIVFVDFDTKIFPIGNGEKLAAAWNAKRLTPDEMLSTYFI